MSASRLRAASTEDTGHNANRKVTEGELCNLKFELYARQAALLLVTHGKTAAARRPPPMTSRVRKMLEGRWEATGKPNDDAGLDVLAGEPQTEPMAAPSNSQKRSCQSEFIIGLSSGEKVRM
jgi:hypothetical protein